MGFSLLLQRHKLLNSRKSYSSLFFFFLTHTYMYVCVCIYMYIFTNVLDAWELIRHKFTTSQEKSSTTVLISLHFQRKDKQVYLLFCYLSVQCECRIVLCGLSILITASGRGEKHKSYSRSFITFQSFEDKFIISVKFNKDKNFVTN